MAKHAAKSRNDLPEKVRDSVNDILASRLCDLVNLGNFAKQAHWNVHGPGFYAVHRMLDELAAEVNEYIDLVAERIVQLGGVADAKPGTVAKGSALGSYGPGRASVEVHLRAVCEGAAKLAKHCRADIDRADKLGDVATADIFTEVVRGLDKWVWMLQAHLD
jgi:starvation-inducible DNA-binding protein